MSTAADHADSGLLVRGLAHELANAGNGLGVGVELLRMLLEAGEQAAARDALEQLVRSCERVNGIARGLRALSIAKDGLRLQTVPAPELSRRIEVSCRAAFRTDIDASLNMSTDPCERVAHCDPEATALAVRQLVDNALDFGARRIQLRLQQQSDTLHLQVIDDGHGVPPGIESRLFSMFVTSRRESGHVGLGLWHSAQMCWLQGIALRCEDPGPGTTTFALHIPTLPYTGG